MAYSKRIFLNVPSIEAQEGYRAEATTICRVDHSPARAKLIEFLGPPSLVVVAHMIGTGFSGLVESIECDIA